MLQARLFAYGDAHRYRLGINSTRLPVNAPKGVKGGARNYEPNGLNGPVQTDGGYGTGYPVTGSSRPRACA